MDIKTENYTGSDCTGSSADANRTLTLSNTGTTSDNGFQVSVDGYNLSLTTNYTVVHASSSTVITFVGKLWDDQLIVVEYAEQISGSGSSADSDDFSVAPLADFGVEVTRTPVTITTDFSGNKAYTDGTDETISVVFMNPNKKFNLDKPGLNESYDAKMYILPTQTMNKYDKITYDSKVYRVDTVSKRNFDGTEMFQRVTLFYLSDE